MRATVLLPRRGLMALLASMALSMTLACVPLAAAPALAAEGAPAGVLASSLAGGSAPVVSSDVALVEPGSGAEVEPVVGSFSVDGSAFATRPDGTVALVSAPASLGAGQAPSGAFAVPATASYGGVDYEVSAVSPYAFCLSGATEVALPASVREVDSRAFRSSDVASVVVAEGNPSYSSFDGALYDADLTSLLLIPEGKQGTVLLPSTAASAAPSVFSHCSLVTQIAVEEGSAAFASENGLLYDASLATLLRVPAGATEIAIHDGCTTIAASAMEGCASLTAIAAPASVTSISQYAFVQPIETLVLPATALAYGDPAEDGEASVAERHSSIVALTASDDGVPAASLGAIEVLLPDDASWAAWERIGLQRVNAGAPKEDGHVPEGVSRSMIPAATMSGEEAAEDEGAAPVASSQSASTYAVYTSMTYGLAVNDADMGSLVTTAEKVISGSVLGPNSSLSAGSSPMKYTMTLSGTSYRIEREDGCYVTGYASPSAGYEFKGWSDTSAGTPQSSMYVSHEASSGSGVLVLTRYAIFAKIASKSIALEPNGGSGGTSAVYYWPGKGYTRTSTSTTVIGSGSRLPLTLPSYAGRTFAGYYSAVTGGTQYVDANGNLTSSAPDLSSGSSSQYTWYAHWTKNAVSTVNLNANGGSGGTATVYLWYGKGWYSTSSPTDSSTPLSTITAPTRAGYTYKGFATTSTATTASYWTSVRTFPSVTSTTFGSATTAKTVNLYAVWAANSYNMLFDPHGGTGGQSGRVLMTYLEALPAISKAKPSRAGYAFEGWYLYNPDTEEYVNVVYDSACEPVLQVWPWGAFALNSDGTPKLEIHAKWAANSYNMLFDPHGGTGGQSGRVLMTYLEELPAISKAKPSRAGYAFEGWYLYNPDTEEYLYMVYDSACESVHEFWPWGAFALNSDGTPKPEIHAKWTLESYSISYELNGGIVSGSSNPTRYDVETATFTLENPQRQGYVFTGWSGTGLEGSSNTVVQVAKGSSGDRAYEAHWAQALSVDAPASVTVQVDLLGVEDQVPASGYIESRSGGALEVVAVSFTPLGGASELFGSNVSEVFLEALAGEGATAADVRFVLDATATETDADKLAAFALPDGFGTRVPIGYRFAIPDDALAAIDPGTSQEDAKSICTVCYTVALAG